MPDNDAIRNKNNQTNSIPLQPLYITSCYEDFADDVAWLNFHNVTPFDIKLRSVSAVCCLEEDIAIDQAHTNSCPRVFLSVGRFNAPTLPYSHNIEDRLHLITPPAMPALKVSLKNMNIPAQTKCFAIIGIQFWADIDRSCWASVKLTFQFSPTYDFTRIFSANIYLEEALLYSSVEEAERIQSVWDEMENATDKLKAYQLRSASFNMQTVYCVSQIIPETSL
ncbi:hypothetical protein [Bartonella sp. CB178]|uniref:hypothetical protein n=1 Tax=Bartonella sp. CB178 TaxID=3112255 RepID=UPI00300E3927